MWMSGESGRGGAGGGPRDPSAPAGGDFAALAPDLTKRIGTILEAVQREADKMLDEARGEARHHVDVGKRRELEETELVRASFGRLLTALSEAAPMPPPMPPEPSCRRRPNRRRRRR